jgi:hypothetical protein
MLFYFRHYQKSLYAFVGTLLFLSFLITTFVRIGDPQTGTQEQPKIIGKLLDGTPLTDLDLHGVMALIDADETQGEPHPLLKTILTQLMVDDRIFQRVFAFAETSVRDPLLECHKKIARQKPFCDPYYADLDIESIYKKLQPRAVEVVEKMRSTDLSSKEYFDLATEYLQLKSAVSPSLVRQFYSYLASLKGAKVEVPQNFALLQTHRNSDLFSKKFMQHVACTLLNGAKYAQSTGISLSNEEVKAEVVAKVLKILKQQGEANTPFHKISIRSIAHGLGLTEERFLESYKTLALFRRFLEIEKTKDLLDPLMAQKISAFANQQAQLELFEMKDEVQISSLEELFKLQCYLEATTKVMQDRRNLGLDLQQVSIDEVSKNAPELLQISYALNLKKLALSELALSIPLKKMVKWQLEDENFYAIADEFKQVQDLGAIDYQLRNQSLEKLDPKVRSDVDNFSRRKMILDDKEILKAAFEKSQAERKDVNFLLSGKTDLFRGAVETREVMDRLETLEDQEIFSFDNEHFYQVQILEKSETPRLLQFKEALDKGQLDLLFERYLKIRYPQVRIMYRDQFEKNGEWLSFELVKANLEKIVFKDLLQAIEVSGGYKGQTLQAPQQFYIDHRFKSHLESVVSQFDAKSMDELKSKLLGLEEQASDFTRQFLPRVSSISLAKAEMKKDFRIKLEEAGVRTFFGPQLYEKGKQAFITLKEWIDSGENGISLAPLQEKIGFAAKEEALDKFFLKLGAHSMEPIFDQQNSES